jgi:hypothetical protein
MILVSKGIADRGQLRYPCEVVRLALLHQSRAQLSPACSDVLAESAPE